MPKMKSEAKWLWKSGKRKQDNVIKYRKLRWKRNRGVAGNLKNAFSDFEIFKGNSCACDAVDRASQLNDIWSGRMGFDQWFSTRVRRVFARGSAE